MHYQVSVGSKLQTVLLRGEYPIDGLHGLYFTIRSHDQITVDFCTETHNIERARCRHDCFPQALPM